MLGPMAVLIFQRRGGFLMQVRLGADPLTVGRDGAVSVFDPDLPPIQAELALEGKSCRLIDRSGHGTPVNGKLVQEALIGDGAEITFGDCMATFRLAEPEEPYREEPPTEGGLAVNALPRDLWVFAEIPGDPGSRREIRLGETLEIGSAVGEGGLRLVAPRVSASHARLGRHDGKLVLHDLGSTNGTWYRGGLAYQIGLPLDARFQVGPFDVWVTEPKKDGPGDKVEWLGEMSSVAPLMHELFAEIKRVAPLAVPVWIHGEIGAGKELVAKALHEHGDRASGPWVPLNCANLEPASAESELFGHAKGAFTGATSSREGAFRTAEGGTLFLDEVVELKKDLQAKLLRALEAHEVKPMGLDLPVKVNARVLCASHRSLDLEVAADRFRADLSSRLNIARVVLPALRDRPGDVMHLWYRFLDERRPDRTTTLGAGVREKLEAHLWPSNVRELKTVLERALYRSLPRKVIEVDDIELGQPGPVSALGNLVDTTGKTFAQIEADVFAAVIRAVKGNRSEAARQLDVHRTTLIKKLKDYGLERVGLGVGEPEG
jgi:transcriptional regulator with AAA-type ATPase domain